MLSHQDSLHRGTAGLYSPHCFFIRADSLADLDPDGDEPTPGAVAIHAHEYVHFLHNVSTCAGAHLFLANIWLLRAIPHCTDANGHVDPEKLAHEQAEHSVSLASRWIKALRGGADSALAEFKGGNATTWSFGSIQDLSESFDLVLSSHTIEGAQVHVESRDRRGKHAAGVVSIGYDLITEGVAYEVDREIRRVNGTPRFDLDDSTDAYPYLFFGALADHLVGRETTANERIDLGVCALLASSPGKAFVQLCEQLARAKPPVSTSSRLPEVIRNEATADFKAKAMEMVSKTLKPALTELAPGSELHEAATDILALFHAGFALRTINPVLELTLVGSPLDGHRFRQRVGGLLDCCVLQEKPEGRLYIQWIGPGIVGRDEKDAARFGRLQSAIHFAQRHLLPSGKLCSTADLRAMPCPYSGACVAEASDGNPEACREAPWTRFLGARPGQPICWYASGVKSLAKRRSAGILLAAILIGGVAAVLWVYATH
ncbi:MAG TPA: hypothetical protein VFU13_12100 [Steroidobacteraceae bacterium]|nr:hypothetical protein [Steroidobacteraceae bacterium]